MYKVGQKKVYSWVHKTQSLVVYYLLIVLFFFHTSVNPLLAHSKLYGLAK